jgi:isoquinoline 1-oxidoreductase beta subunit
VAEVSFAEDDPIRLQRVVCAIDYDLPVNPNLIKVQVEGYLAWALTTVFKQGITYVDGRVQQSNLHDYPIYGFDEMPVVKGQIMSSESSQRGVGEAPCHLLLRQYSMQFTH